MATTTEISWCDSTFNLWRGCTAISPACDNCYARTLVQDRFKHAEWGAGQPRIHASPATSKIPHTWNRQHDKFFALHGRRRRVFTSSLSDVFDNEVDPVWRRELFQIINDTPKLDWMILTKRVGNVNDMLDEEMANWSHFPNNISLGITVCNQSEVDRDVPKLVSLPHLFSRRFLSIEPILGAIDLFPYLDGTYPNTIDLVITGGETGKHARPALPDWFYSIQRQCDTARKAYHHKQNGEWHTRAFQMSTGEPVFRQFTSHQHWVNKARTWVNGGICLDKHGIELKNGGDFMRARDEDRFPVTIMHRVGKKQAGRLLNGMLYDAI